MNISKEMHSVETDNIKISNNDNISEKDSDVTIGFDHNQRRIFRIASKSTLMAILHSTAGNRTSWPIVYKYFESKNQQQF